MLADVALTALLGCRPEQAFVHVDCVRVLEEDGRARPTAALELFAPPLYAAVIEDARTGAVSA